MTHIKQLTIPAKNLEKIKRVLSWLDDMPKELEGRVDDEFQANALDVAADLVVLPSELVDNDTQLINVEMSKRGKVTAWLVRDVEDHYSEYSVPVIAKKR